MTSQKKIPKGWRWVRFQDVAEVGFSTVDKRTVEGEVPVELCNYTDVFYNRRIQRGMPFMAATASPIECERWALRQGDVIFTKDSETPDEIGIPSYVAADMPDVLCGYHLGLARPSTSTTDGAFLARTLASRSSAREFSRVANGVTRFGLTLDATRNIPLLLPPLPEQRQIAAVLDSIDDAIERTEGIIIATEQLRGSLLHQLLSRGVPGRHTEWKDVLGLGTIPADWKMMRLEEVAEVNPRRPRLTVESKTPVTFLPMSAISENAQGIIVRELRPHAEVAKGYTYFEEDDLLFSKITPCLQNGKHTLATGLEGGFGFGTTEFHVVRAKANLSARYMFRVLTQAKIIDRCAKNFTGTAGQQRVQPQILNDLPFPLPSLSEQHSIAELLDSVDMTVAEAREERNKLQSLKTSLADVLLTGQVRVEV